MNSKSPKVTVWIPSYNYGRFLRQSIDSVLKQSVQDFELIVVDDGSQDDSLIIAQDYASRFPEKVVVATHPGRRNLGVSATVNLASALARGEYWCCMGADDLLPEDSLRVRLDFLERHRDVDFVYARARVFDDTDPGNCFEVGNDIGSMPDSCSLFIQSNPVYAMTVMARGESWRQTGLHDESLDYGDWQFWFRMFARCRGSFMPMVVAHQRAHGSNYSIGQEVRKYRQYSRDVVVNIAAIWSLTVPHLDTPRYRARISMMLALHRFFDGRLGEATACLEEASRADQTVLHDHEYVRGWLNHGAYYSASEPAANEVDFLEWFAVAAKARFTPELRCLVREASLSILPSLLERADSRRQVSSILGNELRASAARYVRDTRLLRATAKYLVGPTCVRFLRKLRGLARRRSVA